MRKERVPKDAWGLMVLRVTAAEFSSGCAKRGPMALSTTGQRSTAAHLFVVIARLTTACPLIIFDQKKKTILYRETRKQRKRAMARGVFGRMAGAVALACLTLLPAPAAQAQEYPVKPIRLVVPFAAGGITDIIARMMAEKMSADLKQSVTIDNVTGAGGATGTAAVAKSAPDGYTLVIATSTSMSIYPALKEAPAYDAEKDFAPVAGFGRGQMMIAVPSSSPAKTIEEFIALSKKEPVSFGSAGVGTLPHLAAELMKKQTGGQLRHVPYRGNAAILPDLMTARVQSAYSMSEVVPLAKDNKVRILAVIGSKRDPQLPDVPTLKERGINVELDTWFAIYGPAGIPEPVVQRLLQAVRTAANDPDIVKRLADNQVYAEVRTAAELKAAQDRDIKAFRELKGVVSIE